MRNKFVNLVLTFGALLTFFSVISAQSNKAELVVQNGCFSYIGDLSFSPDGKILAVTCRNEIKIIDAETGRDLKTYGSNSTGLSSPVFSPDGRSVAAGWNNIILWNVETGASKEFNSDSGSHERIVFSADGKLIASISEAASGFVINVWNVESGKLLNTIEANDVMNLSFHENNLVEVAYGGSVTIRNTETWAVAKTFQADINNQSVVEETIPNYNFSSDGKYLAVYNGAKTISVLNTETGKEVQKIGDLPNGIKYIRFGKNDELFLIGENNLTRRDILTGGKKGEIPLKEKNGFEIIAIDPASENLVYEKIPSETDEFEESFLTVRNIKSGADKFTYQRFYKPLRGFEFSHNENFLVTDTGDISGARFGNILLWDLTDKLLPRRLNEKPVRIYGTKFSPNDRFVGALNSSDEGTENVWSLTVWDVFTKNKVFETNLGNDLPENFDFTNDGEYVVISQNNGKTVKLWSIESGKEIADKKIISELLTKEKISATNNNSEENFYERKIQLKRFPGLEASFSGQGVKFIRSGKTIAQLVPLAETNWAVITPDGLFDASPEGRKLIHFIVGLETVSLEQMKDVYYVPGLLRKIMNGEPLPNVQLFSKKDLFPTVEFTPPVAGQKEFTAKVINRGGGIGRVQVLVNGKEFVADARPAGFNPQAKEATIKINLKDAPLFTEGDNRIEVIAGNASGSLTNRGTARSGLAVKEILKDNASKETPNIYIIAGGVSDYTGDGLDLNFAAKDAEDFARAAELGAISLVGDKSKVHIRLLSGGGSSENITFAAPDSKITSATKKEFEQAFADFSKATANDVFIVYLAGHGVSLNINENTNEAGGDTYLYLTQEATTTDSTVLRVKQTREAMTISSVEIKELMKKNNALKQVLILDTCASGQAAETFVAKRNLPSDQIRAIERLKDNTGFYILMGSAANAVSYEASEYGQGLLTYSLLQGMKGSALDNNDANVGKLFEFAVKTVPDLAKNIGGIQQPRIITPDQSRDFPIGRFTTAERGKIPLANPKPLIVNPNLFNPKAKRDDLKLSKMMADQFRELNFATSRGGQTSFVFVEADEMSGAFEPSGTYTVEGDVLKISLILTKSGKQIGNEITVEGSVGDKENLIKTLVSKIVETAKL